MNDKPFKALTVACLIPLVGFMIHAETLTPIGMDANGQYKIAKVGDVMGNVTLPNTGASGTYSGVTTDAQGRVTAGTTFSIANNPSRTIQTVAAAANGWQIDATRNADARYSISTSCTATIGGASSVTIVFEICPTNSAVAGDWVTVGSVSNGQTITLAVVLTSVQTSTLSLARVVPAGYYCRLRSTVVGTASASLANGQEIKM